MSLQRKCIREGVKQILLSATSAGENVTTNRADPILAQHEAYALAIYTLDEQSQTDVDSEPREYLKSLEVAVEGFCRHVAGSSVDDQIDLFVHEIERALLPKLHLPDNPVEIYWGALGGIPATEPDRLEVAYSVQGERLAGVFRLVVRFGYIQVEPEVEGPYIDYLREVGAEWQLAPPDAVAEATDLTDVPQE